MSERQPIGAVPNEWRLLCRRGNPRVRLRQPNRHRSWKESTAAEVSSDPTRREIELRLDRDGSESAEDQTANYDPGGDTQPLA
jgi:hypothetical protein